MTETGERRPETGELGTGDGVIQDPKSPSHKLHPL